MKVDKMLRLMRKMFVQRWMRWGGLGVVGMMVMIGVVWMGWYVGVDRDVGKDGGDLLGRGWSEKVRASAVGSTLGREQYAMERLYSLIPAYERVACGKGSMDERGRRREWLGNDLAANVGQLSKGMVVQVLLNVSSLKGIVVDVGAMDGRLVTFPAADVGREVYAIEPDPRSYESLSTAHRARSTSSRRRIHLFREAAGDSHHNGTLKLYKKVKEYTCLTCMSAKDNANVYEEPISIRTVDSHITQKVFFFKSDTQGYEKQVLAGSTKLFDWYGVSYVMVEFDPRLLGGEATSQAVFSFLSSRGYECFDLRWHVPHSTESPTRAPYFAKRLTNQTSTDFIHSLITAKAYTDLVCFKCT